MFFLPLHSFKQTLFLIYEIAPHVRQCRMQPGEPTSPTSDDCMGDHAFYVVWCGVRQVLRIQGVEISERTERSEQVKLACDFAGFFAAVHIELAINALRLGFHGVD